ncbi:11701_t:CDS:2 [Cetraspora pellucida]|uniref:11701_t:CDS:1 n=1 Tax=Cetraspora pellucida TaxID=1433469 RepID=A0ACA9K5E7_9GLOM|nr:11701_t:CDS:2 [Cetraspora pellucida]
MLATKNAYFHIRLIPIRWYIKNEDGSEKPFLQANKFKNNLKGEKDFCKNNLTIFEQKAIYKELHSIYKKALNDEFVSDAYPVKVVDDVVLEVDCQLVTVKGGVEVDIGANPSAEEQEEALDEASTQVNNVISSFRLQETLFDKQTYTTYLRKYVKRLANRIKEECPDKDMSEWQGKINKFSKKVLNYQFYVGESFKVDDDGEIVGMVGLLNYREDGITPYFSLFKDGLKEVKVDKMLTLKNFFIAHMKTSCDEIRKDI